MKLFTHLLFFMATSLILSSPVISQKKKTPPAAKSPTAGMHKYTGFFNFFYEPATDKIFLEIASFEEEFLYVNSLAAGIGSNDIGLDRGQLGGDKVVRFVKVGPKVLMIQPNYGYRVTSTNPFEMEAVEQAFAQSVLWGFKVQHEYDGKVLVDATEFLQRDAHKVAEKLESANQGTYKLDKSRTAFYLKRTKSFPENSEFEATLTFTGKAEGSYIKSVAPSPDAVTVRQHHSFIKLPDNNYTPRVFDPRAGYFGISYADYGTPIDQPLVKRFIARHRLRKKDPAAEKSEAVEPIVYHLDRGTPEPIRSALLEGASWWNQAFEAAGYINAFQVKMLPEDADPMDVRYNLIQWVHRSTRGWSYGSSVGDPRTGEIIKGHVSLGSLRVRQDFLIAIGLMSPYKSDGMPENMKEMALARLRQLSAHEVGHTLGLAHNYSASMDGRTSVMDYPHPKVNIVDGKLDLSDAYDSGIGSWDKVSIAYGYQDFPAGTSEEAGLKSILSKAYQQDGLSFISDQDARPAGSAHPRAHLWDNGRNAATELDHVLAVRRIALNQFSENNVAPGQPLATLEESLVPIYFFHRYQMEAAVKIVGGLDYTYAMRGDSQEPTAMIDPALQQQALTAVLKTISPTTLTLSEDLLKIIPPRPLGYRRSRETIRTRTGLTFDPIAPAETAADMTLRFLLHPERATRLIEHHARDSSQPDLSDVLNQLMDVSWKSAPVSGLQGEVRRAVNSVVLLNMMRLAGNDRASMQVRAITSQHLVNLQDWLEQKADGTKLGAEKAHLLFAVAQIKQFRKNPESIKGAEPLNPPDGSPIGMDKVYCSFHE